jgi:hypothetical protein
MVKINLDHASNITLNGVNMIPCLLAATSTTGVQLAGTGGSGLGLVNLTNNQFSQVTPLSYTPNNETMVIGGNIGLDNVFGTVASSGTISFTNKGTDIITGTTSVTNITNSAWSFRSHYVIAQNGFTFSSGGAGAGVICTPSVTLAANQMAIATWDANNAGCWHIH